MILNINGWPGAGKQAVATCLANILGAHLITNHQIIDLAATVHLPGSSSYYATVRALRAVIFGQLVTIPITTPIILTNVVARKTASGFSEENWETIRRLANERRCRLLSIRLSPTIEENERRLTHTGRNPKKMGDAVELAKARRELQLYDDGADAFLNLDNTNIEPSVCASVIAEWLEGISK